MGLGRTTKKRTKKESKQAGPRSTPRKSRVRRAAPTRDSHFMEALDCVNEIICMFDERGTVLSMNAAGPARWEVPPKTPWGRPCGSCCPRKKQTT